MIRSRRSSTNKNRKFLLLLIPAIFIILVVFIFKSNFLKITQIEVLSNANCVDESIKDKSNLLNKNLFFLNQDQLSNEIKGKFICIKKVKFSKILPSKIRLEVEGRAPMFKLALIKDWEASAASLIDNTATPSAHLTEIFISDEEGVIFSKENVENLPVINYLGKDISIGVVDDLLKKAVIILPKLNSEGLQTKNTYILSNLFILNTTPKVIFDLNEDINMQFASLQLILHKAKIEGVALELIDLRFDKPVIKYAPKKK